ncbi:SIP domain-containing protein [Streptomyces sp. NPDC046324]|uniref:SIP domain-containing protein n=1 Tax=Streptomyces sp. NPDC046324 TaxID=3154915 RepID=UPI0033DCB2DA
MFGPSAYFAAPLPLGAADWTLLAADGCSLPALATVAEALPPGHRAVAFVHVGPAATVVVERPETGRAASAA